MSLIGCTFPRISLLRSSNVVFINCDIFAWFGFAKRTSFWRAVKCSSHTSSVNPSGTSGITAQKSDRRDFNFCFVIFSGGALEQPSDEAFNFRFFESYLRMCLNRFFIDSDHDPWKQSGRRMFNANYILIDIHVNVKTGCGYGVYFWWWHAYGGLIPIISFT